MKKIRVPKQAHSSDSKIEMGDYYGTGVKQKVGRVRDDYFNYPMKSQNMGKPPKNLA